MKFSPRRPHLTVHLLEDRAVPAGLVTADLTAGLLTLVGDDFNNSVRITRTAADVTITPDATTSVNGGAVGVPFSFGVVPIAMQAFMNGGDDTINIATTGNFTFPGPLGFNLGDGNNTLDLTTTGTISATALFVVGGDGTDNVAIRGAAGSSVTGTASFSYGLGDSTTTLRNINFTGATGVMLTAPGGGTIDATNVRVTQTLNTAFGPSAGTINTTTSTLGGLTVTGRHLTVNLQTGTTVNGAVALTGLTDPT